MTAAAKAALGSMWGCHARGGLHLVDPDDMQHRVDERQVSERVREVAQVAAAPGIEVLCVQAERAGVRQKPLAQRTGAVGLAYLGERRDEPERAGDKGLAG